MDLSELKKQCLDDLNQITRASIRLRVSLGRLWVAVEKERKRAGNGHRTKKDYKRYPEEIKRDFDKYLLKKASRGVVPSSPRGGGTDVAPPISKED